ncbi:MAG TPA: NAD(P)H-quinone oxidoreductase subunit 3 [Candidatus Methanoperedenaceae archaeon]|nr:NAD(P)H-quinone oxidoreductase subunit 3 [Candidatus Methanoperedenaceae archaeon]
MSGIIDSFIPVAIFLVFGFVMPVATMIIVKQISPRSQAGRKLSTYESGSVPFGDARIMFNVQYYLFAIVFVIFDVEVMFLYPWVTVYLGVDKFFTTMSVIEVVLFVLVLFVGYLYALKKGALQWVK